MTDTDLLFAHTAAIYEIYALLAGEKEACANAQKILEENDAFGHEKISHEIDILDQLIQATRERLPVHYDYA